MQLRPEECNQSGPMGFVCTLANGHDGLHKAFGDEGEPPFEQWPNVIAVDPQVTFPHRCPGEGCAICRYERLRPFRAREDDGTPAV